MSLENLINDLTKKIRKVQDDNKKLQNKLNRYENALREIAEETGTPYSEIARKVLEI